MSNPLESKLRRQLMNRGLRLEKTPARHWLRREYGEGYMVLANNQVVLGCTNHMWDASIGEVSEFVAGLASAWR